VKNGDTLTTLDYRKLVHFHKQQKGIITIASHKRRVNIDFGVLNVDSYGALEGYDEKPTLDYLVSMGVYVLNPEVLQYIPANQRIDFPDIVKTFLTEEKKSRHTLPMNTGWISAGMMTMKMPQNISKK